MNRRTHKKSLYPQTVITSPSSSSAVEKPKNPKKTFRWGSNCFTKESIHSTFCNLESFRVEKGDIWSLCTHSVPMVKCRFFFEFHQSSKLCAGHISLVRFRRNSDCLNNRLYCEMLNSPEFIINFRFSHIRVGSVSLSSRHMDFSPFTMPPLKLHFGAKTSRGCTNACRRPAAVERVLKLKLKVKKEREKKLFQCQ